MKKDDKNLERKPKMSSAVGKSHKKRKKKRGPGRVIRNILLVVVIVFAVVFLVGNLYLYKTCKETVFSCARYGKKVVAESTEADFKPNQASEVYAADGTLLAKLYEDTESSYLKFEEIPKDVINAFVAVEDRTFWKNSGIDAKGIVRVLLNFVKTKGDVMHGASTITQQLSRDIFLTNEKSIERKVKEIFIALNINKKYSKEQVIEFYCNNVCFANGVYGIEDASQTYFEKPASELTLSEAAYLCSIPNRPEYYDPFKDSSTALTRRDKILEDMCECGYISQEEMNEAKGETITVVEEKDDKEFYNYETTFVSNCVTEYFMEYYYDFDFQYQFDSDEEYQAYHEKYNEVYANAKHRLKTGGYQIETTIDVEAQQELQKILNENLSFNKELYGKDQEYNLQGSMTVIDNNTGKVVAAIGGREKEDSSKIYSMNRTYQDPRQPGSSIKPLVVYGPALMKGYDANSSLPEINVKQAKTSKKKVSEMTGPMYSLRSAVENSKNGTAYWLFNDITPKYGLSFLEEMQFSHLHPNDANLSTALGGMSYGTTTWEMANAFYTMYNSGTYTKADCITSIEDSDGNEIYEDPEAKEVYSPEASEQMIDIMRGVLTRGTAKRLNWYSATGTEAAGKTGTTDDNKDGWFCGFTPYYTISVWVGCVDHSKVPGLSGGTYPARLWKDAMLYMIEDKPEASFDLSIGNSYQPEDPGEDEEPDAEEPTDGEDPQVQDPGDSDGTIEQPGQGETPQGGIDENPTEPVDPEQPTDPDKPTEPTDPEEPTEPTDPNKPTDGENPDSSTDPANQN